GLAAPVLVAAQLVRFVGQQSVGTRVVPRKAAALVRFVLLVANLGDVADDEAALGLLIFVVNLPGSPVSVAAGAAQNVFHVDRPAEERQRGEDPRSLVVVLGVVGVRPLGRPVLLLVSERKRPPPVPENQRADAEELVRDQRVTAVALVR